MEIKDACSEEANERDRKKDRERDERNNFKIRKPFHSIHLKEYKNTHTYTPTPDTNRYT